MITDWPSAVIFDLDGTLVDSLPGIEFSVKAAFVACDVPLRASNLRPMIGPPIRSILAEAGGIDDSAKLSDLEAAFRQSYDTEGWKKTTCYPDAQSVLQQMHAERRRLFVVTNKPRHIAIRILERAGILQFFDEVLTRDSRNPEFRGKEELVLLLLLRYDLPPETCLMVGDTSEDAMAAATAEIRFAHVTHGYGSIGENSPLSVHFTCSNFQQLSQLLIQEPAHD